MEFRALASAYLDQHLKGKPSYPFYCRLYEQFFADWTEHRTSFQLQAWHKSLAGRKAHANKALGFLKAMYRWGTVTGDATGQRALWEGENPAVAVKRFSAQSRERVFSDLELTVLFMLLEFTSDKLRAFLTILLCTGCRMSEARLMQWSHLDLVQGFWLKPTTKTGRSQRIPIPRQMLAALELLQRTSRSVYVFTGLYDRPWSRCAAEKAWGLLRKGTLEQLTLHDFRRTVATRIYDQTKDEKLVKAIINHRDNTMSGVYIRLQYAKISAALQSHADALWAFQEVCHETPHAIRLVADSRLCAAPIRQHADAINGRGGISHDRMPADFVPQRDPDRGFA